MGLYLQPMAQGRLFVLYNALMLLRNKYSYNELNEQVLFLCTKERFQQVLFNEIMGLK